MSVPRMDMFVDPRGAITPQDMSQILVGFDLLFHGEWRRDKGAGGAWVIEQTASDPWIKEGGA